MSSRVKSFYFIGIGGVGMSGLAEILLKMGHRVSGSDRESSEITAYLEQQGAQIFLGHHAENIGPVDYLVYSSAISPQNPEMIRADELKIPRIRRAEMLAQLFNRKFGIGIAGTHGKTTTTSMLGSILMEAQLDPTIIVGGKFQNLLTNARLGGSDYLIAEADEYDRSFLALNPRICVITSVEADHLDIYKDLDDLKTTFVQYANQTAFDGLVIINGDDPNLQKMAALIQPSVVRYGLKNTNDLWAEDINYSQGGTRFKVFQKNKQQAEIKLNVPGKHNVLNALAAIAVALELEIPLKVLVNGLESFKGVGRRFETIGLEKDILIVDDYAHHPTEVAAALEAARKGWDRRILAVFQPHLFSRTRDFSPQFAQALDQADLALILDVYPAREEALPGISGQLIADELTTEHLYIADKEKLIERLMPNLRPGDLVLFLGAGDIWQYSRKLLRRLQEN